VGRDKHGQRGRGCVPPTQAVWRHAQVTTIIIAVCALAPFFFFNILVSGSAHVIDTCFFPARPAPPSTPPPLVPPPPLPFAAPHPRDRKHIPMCTQYFSKLFKKKKKNKNLFSMAKWQHQGVGCAIAAWLHCVAAKGRATLAMVRQGRRSGKIRGAVFFVLDERDRNAPVLNRLKPTTRHCAADRH